MTASKGIGRPGPPRKPTALALLHGDDKKNPSRVNRREPKPLGAVVKPADLVGDVEASEIWDRLAPELERLGVLTVADVDAFGEFCKLLPISRAALNRVRLELTGELKILPGQASPTTAYTKVMTQVLALAARFGLTPADRARLVSGEAPRGDSSADLLTS